jgi:CRISPR-associated protein Cmr1
VQIRVIRQAKAPTKLEIFKQGDAFRLIDDRLKALAYGAFPLRGTDAAKKHGMLWQYDDSFELELRVRPPVTETKEGALVSHSNHTKELLEDLHRALWAWLHFGSLGGRTRRGFGAIKLENATGFELKSIKDGWPDASGRKEVEWPVLPASSNAVVFAATPFSRGKDAQELLLGLLHRMRQGDLGRTPSSPRPGRSKWPEPDAIRDRYKITSGRHGKPIHSPRIDVFPRAAFGAPVIFHFKTEPGEREPPDTTLLPYLVQPENTKKPEKVLHRMASSLLLRPHHEPGGMVRPMALRLDHPKPHGWGLAERTRGPEIKLDYRVRNELEDHHAAQIDPLNLDGKITTDPVDNYLKRLAKL